MKIPGLSAKQADVSSVRDTASFSTEREQGDWKSAIAPFPTREDPNGEERHQHEGDWRSAIAPSVVSVGGEESDLPRVTRVEALLTYMTRIDRIVIFLCILLFSYATDLEASILGSAQPIGLSSIKHHSLHATVLVFEAVISAAFEFLSGKLSDVLGRVETFCLGVLIYSVGLAVKAAADDVPTFSGGAVLYALGSSLAQTLLVVTVAESTSTRSRVFFSCLQSLPFIINPWASGRILKLDMASTTWKWAIGMWAIVGTVMSIPLIISVSLVLRKIERSGKVSPEKKYHWPGMRTFLVEQFWRLDIIGVILFAVMFGLILVPLTLAGGLDKKWGTGHTIAPIVVGGVCVLAFALWEYKTPHTIMSYRIFKNPSIWAVLGISMFFSMSFAVIGNYFFTLLVVAFGFSEGDATTINKIFEFVEGILVPILGLVIYKVRRLKPFIVFGSMIHLVGLGLMIRYRGDPLGHGKVGVVASMVLLGVSGSFTIPTSAALMQSVLPRKDLAATIGMSQAMSFVGTAIGSSIAGAIWTNVLPPELQKSFAYMTKGLSQEAYESPLTQTAAKFVMGSPVRTSIVFAYRRVQRTLAITAICIAAPVFLLALVVPNIELNDEQTLAPKGPSNLARSDMIMVVTRPAEIEHDARHDSDSTNVEKESRTSMQQQA